MKRIEYSPEAERDLLEIWRYTAERWSETQADTYLSRLFDLLDDAAAGRLTGLPADEIRPGYRRLIIGSHVAFYTESERALTVMRVLHQSMDAGQHLG